MQLDSDISHRENLLSQLNLSFEKNAEKIAVSQATGQITYHELGKLSKKIHDAISYASSKNPVNGTIGVLLGRSANAYATMIASVRLGITYVPLNTSYPLTRLKEIANQANVSIIVYDESSRSIAEKFDENIVVLSCEKFHAIKDDGYGRDSKVGDIAYQLYTSGSTGRPKGVPITYGNLVSFLDNISKVIKYKSDDICSQVCELSFDVSVQEIFLALLNGCTLCPASPIDLFNPADFIKRNAISVWTAVPSLSRVLLKNGQNYNGALDNLRLSIFNGEALTAGIAEQWLEAAPHTILWNTYGPTECTVAVTAMSWKNETELTENGILSIGKPLANCTTALLIEDKIIATDDAQEGCSGELLLSTPQQFDGYSTPGVASPFIECANGTKYYCSGDFVLWRDSTIFYLGRLDTQVKIGGHRIELYEIEHSLRAFYHTNQLAVVAYPPQLPTELVLFVDDAAGHPSPGDDTHGLPAYMIPQRTIKLEKFPLSSHGKLDRNALLSLIT